MVSVLLAEPRPRFRWSAVSGGTIQTSSRVGTASAPRSAGISGGGRVAELNALETLWCADELALASRSGTGADRLFMMRLPASAHPDGVVRRRCRSAGVQHTGWGS